jgi:tetratricopeptide (TPR) repeat protein
METLSTSFALMVVAQLYDIGTAATQKVIESIGDMLLEQRVNEPIKEKLFSKNGKKELRKVYEKAFIAALQQYEAKCNEQHQIGERQCVASLLYALLHNTNHQQALNKVLTAVQVYTAEAMTQENLPAVLPNFCEQLSQYIVDKALPQYNAQNYQQALAKALALFPKCFEAELSTNAEAQRWQILLTIVDMRQKIVTKEDLRAFVAQLQQGITQYAHIIYNIGTIENATFIQSNAPALPPHNYKLPRKPIYCIGRDAMLEDMHQHLSQAQALVLMNGIGGIGKTTLAVQYAYQYADAYQTVRYIYYKNDFKSSYVAALNPHYALEGTVDQCFERLLAKELQCPAARLMIIDNFDQKDDKEIQGSWTKDWKVLITSRLHLDPTQFHSIKVAELSPSDAFTLFKHHFGAMKTTETEQVRQLLPLLHYNTLLIVLVAKIAKACKGLMSIATLLERYQQQQYQDEDLQIDIALDEYFAAEDRAKARNILGCINTAFDISGIAQQPDALYLLQQFALTPTEGINKGLFREGAAPDMKTTAFINGCNALAEQGWIDEVQDGEAYCMHPLLQEIVRYHYPPTPLLYSSIISYLKIKLFEALNTNFITAIPYTQYAATVVQWLYKSYETACENLNEYTNVATLSNNLSEIYRAMGQLPEALMYQQKAITIQKQVLGKNHPNLAASYNNLSLIYQDMGQLPEALTYQQKAIAIVEQVLGKNHPDVATSYNNLSLIYQDMGQLPEALTYQQKAICIFEHVLGKNHPYVATSYNNVSSIYQAMGHLPEALTYQQKAIAIDEHILGNNHPDLAASYNNIAQIYQAMGRLPEALSYQQKAIAIDEQVSGENHPDLAASYNNLSTIYQAMGQLSEALAYQQKAIAIREQVLGKNHPDVANSYSNLSLIYQDMGQLSKALTYQQKAIVIREKALGKNHPDVANSYNNLSGIYQAMGQLSEALAYQQKAIAIREQVLGKNHPDVATSYNNLSGIYQAMGQFPEALRYQQRAIAIREQVLGENHPNLATSYGNIAYFYYQMNDIPQAKAYIARAVAILKHNFPNGHPNLTTMLQLQEHINEM